MGRPVAARDLAACLAHPLVAAGADRRTHLDLARGFEVRLRTKFASTVPLSFIADWAAKDAGRGAWSDWLSGLVADLASRPPVLLGDLADWHISLVQRLFSGPGGAPDALWEGEAGIVLRKLFDDLAASADYAGPFGAADYASLIDGLLGQAEVRSAEMPHPGVMIWGTLEARVQTVDIAILGGLNEGTWPKLPGPDPWLSRGMRAQAGLLSPERRIGLSAHDFQSAAGAAELVLSRAVRDDDAMTVPSRWINRLTNLLAGLPAQHGGEALAAARAGGEAWVAKARAIEAAYAPQDPEPRPSVIPPPEARPARLSVTQIATLIRDPYAIYAREVLGLTQLPALGQAADARLRGTLLHRVFERFLRSASRAPGLLTASHLLKTADEVLAALDDEPALRAQWTAAVRRIAGPFVAEEALRWQAATPAWFEVRGEFGFDLPDASPFRLVGIADRIDVTPDGRAAIYDYKSGHVPSPAEQKAFDKQLYLLALMAEAGAFRDPDPVPPLRVSHVGYLGVGIRLSGNSPEIDTDILATFRTELLSLLAAYRQPDQGYTARAIPQREDDRGDYDQLSRFGEWGPAAPPRRIPVAGG